MKPETVARRLHGRRCLVTGGAGFIGSNLVRALLDSGADVTVLDDLSTGRKANLPQHDCLTLIEGDLASHPHLNEVVSEADYVFHLAAMVGNFKSTERPEDDARTNILGSVRLFNACRNKAVEKVVHASSSAIFGESETKPITEDHPQAPESFYGLSKMAGEKYALLAHSLWGVPTVCLRYFNVYGLPIEVSDYAGVISIFFRRLLQNRPLLIYGDGGQSRDFVHVADVIQASLRAATLSEPGAAFNIGTGRKTTIQNLAKTMIGLTGHRVDIEYRAPRGGEVRESVADIRRARDLLGYRPRFSLQMGLERMWRSLLRRD